MLIGIDLVDIHDLAAKTARTPNFINHLLTQTETSDNSLPSLAGKIAAKEAIIKTGYLKIGDWLKVQILNDETGHPFVYNSLGEIIPNLQVSISHTKTTAVAVALYEENKNS